MLIMETGHFAPITSPPIFESSARSKCNIPRSVNQKSKQKIGE